jgi:glycosyltransferase involved in cell wall biosynthesis
MTGRAGALTRPEADVELEQARLGSTPRVKVSIILSARNEEKHLQQALDSIANQTFTDWECLIFNDGSTDRTAELARAMQHRIPDLSYSVRSNPGDWRSG